jgi:DNA-binding PadR family transcriptional regulator
MLSRALLALLSRRSLTGYDLTKRFYGSVAFCWHAHQSQIYTELGQLAERGWVTAKREVGSARPNRRVYTLTEPGREALVTWLRTPESALALKDPWLLRIWAVDLLRPEEARTLLDACRRLHEERRQTYRSITRVLERGHGGVDETRHTTLVGPYLCLQQGIWHEEMYIRWCRWAQGRLAARSRRGRPRRRRASVDLHTVIKRANGTGPTPGARR